MAGPFGVELPDSFDSQPAPEAPTKDVAQSAPENDGSESPTKDTATPEIPDLDKLERVRFKGRELTRKELEDGWLMREDYTRKTQSLSEARKQAEQTQRYADNFEYDLEKVIEDPSLLEQMREIYPPKFVRAAEKVLSRMQSETGERNAQAQTQLSPDIRRKLETVESLAEWKQTVEQKVAEANSARAEAQIDSWFDKLGKKYSEADHDVVTAKAIVYAEKLESEGKAITEAHLEKLFKADHEFREQRYAERYRTQIQKQKAVQAKGKDMGAGGGVPQTPPNKSKTIKDATNQFLSDIEAGRIS